VVSYKMLKPGAPVGTFGRELEEAYGENYQDSPTRKQRLKKAFNIVKKGPNKGGPFKPVKDDPCWKSAPPGAPGGLEEGDD